MSCGWFQLTVKDVRSGKVVEGEGGARALVMDERNVVKAKAVPAAASKAVNEMDASSAKDGLRQRGNKKPATKKASEEGGDEILGDGPSRVVESGLDILDNNQVNILMAATMSIFAMAVGSFFWGVPLRSIFDW